MSRRIRTAGFLMCLAALTAMLPALADAQGRGRDRRSPPPHGRTVPGRGHFVFVGGYFYDPFFGPYPWWPPVAYPGRYYPVFDLRASVRIQARPKEAAVYVDGFYAGIVDDFDGVFQELALPPGGHEIALFHPGYRTARQSLYLRPGSRMNLHESLEPLPPGVASEAPPVAPPVPPPPEGTYTSPRLPPPGFPPPVPPVTATRPQAAGYGSLSLRVQPPDADVFVDGERWVSSDEGQFVLQVSAGTHRVEVAKTGYQRFSTEIVVREGEATPLNVSLSAPRPPGWRCLEPAYLARSRVSRRVNGPDSVRMELGAGPKNILPSAKRKNRTCSVPT